MFLVLVYQQWNQGESKALSVWNKTKFLEPMRCQKKKKKKREREELQNLHYSTMCLRLWNCNNFTI